MYECSTFVQPLHIEQLVSEHPLLVELTLRGFTFLIGNAITLIHRFNSLKSFCFQIRNVESYNRLVLRLDNRWIPSRNQNIVNLIVRQGWWMTNNTKTFDQIGQTTK